MAIFNPAVQPLNPKDSTGDSKGVSNVVADTSAATAITGLTTLAGDVVTGIDTGIKDNLKDKITSGVDTARAQYTARLEALSGTGVVGNAANGDPNATNAQAAKPLPSGLKDLPATLDQLEGGKKYGMTYYLQRLDSFASQLRSQYPGYRDYIDEEFKKASGKDIANSLIDSRIQDINAAATATNAAKTKAYAYLERPEIAGLPDYKQAVAKVDSNQWGLPELLQWSYPRTSRLAQMEYEKKERESRTGQNAMTAEDNKDELNNYAYMVSIDFFTRALVEMGYDTKDKQQQFLSDMASGKNGMTGPKAQQAAEVIRAKRAEAYTQMWNWAHNDVDSFGKSRANRIGNDGDVKTGIDNGLQLFDQWQATLTDEKSGIAYRNFNASKRTIEDTQQNIFNDKDLRGYYLISAATKNLLGDPASAAMTSYFLQNKLEGKLGNLVENKMMELSTAYNPDGKIPTFKAAIEAYKDKNIKSNDVNSKMVDYGLRIQDRSVSEKERINLVKGYFGQGNESSMSEFIRDQRDPQTGKLIPGQFTIFNRLTSPNMTQAIKELDKSQPGTFAVYQNWVEQTFAKELYPREMADLRDLSSNPNFKFAWDAGNSQFTYKYTGQAQDGITFQQQNAVNAVNRINLGLLNLKTIAENGGMPVNAYLLRTLQEMGAPEMVGMPNAMFHMLGSSLLKSSGKTMTDK